MMFWRTRLQWLVLMLAVLLGFGNGAVAAQTGDFRDLRDLAMVIDPNYPFGQWAAGSMDTVNGNVPVDTTERYNGEPTYRVTGYGSDWWGFGLSSELWESWDLTPYFANGAIQFAVKGATGGEDVTINLVDQNFARANSEQRTALVPISDYVAVTTGWQVVTIPLADLNPPADFARNAVLTIEVSTTYNGDMTLWIGDIRFTSPDQEPAVAAVRVNQVGYLPNGAKVATVAGFPDDFSAVAGTPFSIIDAATRGTVFSGQLTEAAAFDAVVSGERVLHADFSALTAPGSYRLQVGAAGIAESEPFAISAEIYTPLLIDSARYFYLQRQGIAIDAATGGSFARGVGHPQDSSVMLDSGSTSFDASQGWYDAGDYGKYVNAGATAVTDLLWAYELFPAQFTDNQFNIAESGNGVPDILDEVKWETDWLLKMQDPTSGGFYHMVQATELTTPDAATDPRYVADVDGGRSNVRPTSSTASTVAALAHAAIVFEPFDAVYADTLLQAARDGWAYLAANPGGVDPISGAPYADWDDAGERFWAAAMLFRATGEAQFDSYVAANYLDFANWLESTFESAYFVSIMEMHGYLAYIHADAADATLRAQMLTLLNGWRDEMVARHDASTWRTTLMDDDHFWGSNMQLLNTPLTLAVIAEAQGGVDADTVRLTQDALNYLLGSNPLQRSYVSGHGENSLADVFSNIYSFDGIAAFPPGIVSGGANGFSNSLLYSNFAGKRHVDSNSSFSTNEHTVYWNSPLVFVSALLLDSAETTTPTAVTIRPTQSDSAALPIVASASFFGLLYTTRRFIVR